MNKKQLKYEAPTRLEELKPKETLIKIGLEGTHTVCDIGAGSGVFTIPASEITQNTVYALDINEEMLKIIRDKVTLSQIGNVVLKKVVDDHYDLPDNSIDFALMVTVLHEIESKMQSLKEVKRILKHNGKYLIIEFHKRQTAFGPPVEERLSKDEVKEMLGYMGFTPCNEFDLGDNFYCLVFTQIIN